MLTCMSEFKYNNSEKSLEFILFFTEKPTKGRFRMKFYLALKFLSQIFSRGCTYVNTNR